VTKSLSVFEVRAVCNLYIDKFVAEILNVPVSTLIKVSVAFVNC